MQSQNERAGRIWRDGENNPLKLNKSSGLLKRAGQILDTEAIVYRCWQVVSNHFCTKQGILILEKEWPEFLSERNVMNIWILRFHDNTEVKNIKPLCLKGFDKP